MTISGGSALPKDEIDRMVREAEAHAEEDKLRREEAEARNNAEQLVYSTEKFLNENGEKVPADTRGPVDEALKELKESLAKTGDDAAKPDDLNAKVTHLNEVSQKMGAAMYAATQAEQGGAEGAGSNDAGQPGGAAGGSGDPSGATGGDDDIIDAEVVDEDDKDQK